MTFAAPLMLAGLAALAVPVVIHLLNRSRSAAVDWPTLRFLQLSHQQSAQRRRLKNLLILLLRLALLALLVLAMARPFRQDRQWQQPPDLPTTLIIVLDNSYSMGAAAGGTAGTRFDRARELALAQVAALSLEDEVGVVLANERAAVLTEHPTRDRQRISSLLHAARLSALGTDVAPALAAAFALAQLDAPDTSADGAAPPDDRTVVRPQRRAWRQVLLITDMQRAAWGRLLDGDLLALIERPTPLTVLDVGDPAASNRWVTRARVVDRLTAGGLKVEVEVARCGEAGSAGQVSLWIDEQKIGTPERVGASRQLELVMKVPAPGTHVGTVQLEEDGLPIDDRATFAFHVAGGRRLTIVDGDPSELPHLSETWFLEAVLAQRQTETIAIERLAPEALSARGLEGAGCLVLANVERLDAAALRHVADLLRRRGSALVVLGDKVDVEHYRAHWDFLPLQLAGRLGDPGRRHAHAVVVEQPDHPVLAGPLDLSAARFFAMIGADPTTLRAGGAVLASFSNGAPWLVEGPADADPNGGGGNVMLLTSGLDADWSNLPYRRVFVPLVDRLIAYLTQSRITTRGTTLGRPVRFSGPALLEGRSLTIAGPDGSTHTVAATGDAATGGAVADFRATDAVGAYRVSGDDRFGHGGAFAVNLDTRESNLQRVDSETIRDAFGDVPVRFVTDHPTTMGSWHQGAGTQLSERLVPYWPWLLLAAFVVFTVEAVLANVFTRRRRPPPLPGTAYVATRRTERVAAGRL